MNIINTCFLKRTKCCVTVKLSKDLAWKTEKNLSVCLSVCTSVRLSSHICIAVDFSFYIYIQGFWQVLLSKTTYKEIRLLPKKLRLEQALSIHNCKVFKNILLLSSHLGKMIESHQSMNCLRTGHTLITVRDVSLMETCWVAAGQSEHVVYRRLHLQLVQQKVRVAQPHNDGEPRERRASQEVGPPPDHLHPIPSTPAPQTNTHMLLTHRYHGYLQTS